MRIDEKHQCLSYYKSSAPGESPAGMIDLKIVKDITPYEKCTSYFIFISFCLSLSAYAIMTIFWLLRLLNRRNSAIRKYPIY